MDELNCYYRTNKRIINKDIWIIFLVLTIPLISYIHNLVPRSESINLGFFVLESGYFKDIQVWVYIIGVKLVSVLGFLIWYITCRHWWKFILLIPLTYFIIQFYYVINPLNEVIDSADFFLGLLFSMPFIILLVLISRRIDNYHKTKILSQEMNLEVSEVLEEVLKLDLRVYKSVRKNLKELRKNKTLMTKECYLNRLIKLKNELDQTSPFN